MPDHTPPGLPPRPAAASARDRGAGFMAVLRALISLAVLVTLLAGLPTLLWWGTSIVAPSGISALSNLLSTQDSGQVFLLGLAVAGWTGWALFAVSVLVEIPAQLRGRSAPQFRLLVGQRAAATLVGAVLLALPTGTAGAASASPAAASPAATSALSPSGMAGEQSAGAQSERGVAKQQTVTHTVATTKPAESLWSIAQERLGDGNRWEEIAALNDGRVMADGRTFHPDAPIHTGWILNLPVDAQPVTATATSPSEEVSRSKEPGMETQGGGSQPAKAEYTVQAGDNLSQIAADELGDETKYPAIFELNKGEAQPGGGHFTDPDRIFPGQNLTLPSPTAAPDGTSPDPDTAHHPGTPDAQNPDSEQPDRTQPSAPSSTPAPEGPAPSASPPSAQPSKDSAADSGTPPASSTPSSPSSSAQSGANPSAAPAVGGGAEQGDDSVQQVALVAGIGALLAASLAGALGVRRILQQRRRRAGETIAIDSDPTRLEQVLNTAGEPASAALLDTALRTLASQSGSGTDRELPVIRGARITGSTVHLLPDDKAATAPAPFTGSGEPGTWALDPTATLLDEAAAQDVPAPYPGLVTLGATEQGDLLLVDLLKTVLLLQGEPDDILAVTRALALEAGTAGWTDHTEIVTVGLGSRLATLLPKGRVRTMPNLQSVVADLGALLVEVHQQDEAAPDPLPWILVCAGDVDGEQVWQLADAVSAARQLPIAVVLPANDATRQAFPDADLLSAAPQTPVALPHLTGCGPVELQRLSDEQYRAFIHALEVTEEPAQPATGGWKLSEDHAHAATTPRTGAHTVYLDEGGTDPGNPFPALLASASPDRQQTQSADQRAGNPGAAAGTQEGDTRSGTAAIPSVPGQAAWSEPAQADNDFAADVDGDHSAVPLICILGPLQVSGISASGHGPKVAALAALIYLRPGRSADTLCTAMDPVSPWSTRTLQSRLSEIRSRFGNTADGAPYLPRPKNGYAFRPGIRSDWDCFQQHATRALAAGPDTGIPDLETALGLVRGKPFEGQDYPWADSIQQEIISRVVDVAHTLASWLTEGDNPDLDAARHAVLRGLDIDETSEVLYRDWMHIEWATGNTTGVRKAIARLQQITRTYDISLEPLTEQIITLVLSDAPQTVPAS